MKTRKVLTLDDAKAIGQAAEAEAVRRGWNVTIAICDEGGHLLWLQRMDGAPPMGAVLGPQKAHACIMTRKPSKLLEDMVNNGRYAGLRLPVTPIEGGEMVVVDGDVIGAVGVSGVLPHQDAEVARAGIEAIGASCSL